MAISPRIAISAAAIGLGGGAATALASRRSSSDGAGRFIAPAAGGLLGATAIAVGLLSRGRSTNAILGALPFVGGALLAGSIAGGVIGALTRPAEKSGGEWGPGKHGSYEDGTGGEAWDGEDPVGTAHPTKYDAKPGDLLPNVVPQQPRTVAISREGNKRFLDFATTTGNLGVGPLELVKRHEDGLNRPIMQVITNEDGSRRELPTDRDSFEDGPNSNHLAFNDFARYELYHAGTDGKPEGEIAKSQYKESFLIIDTDVVDATIDPTGKHRIDRSAVPGAEVQGISPGHGDTYGPGLCGQSFDITNLADGRYVLRQTMDPGNRFVESDDADNTRDTVIEISGSTATIITSAIVPG